MFVLYEMVHIVRVHPSTLNMKLNDAIYAELNSKLANRVVLDVGLCMAVLDILEMGESFIIPGDAGSHTKTKFRTIVFRPFVDEILVGKIKSIDSSGLKVTLDFFDDIRIPSSALQHPSRFNEREGTWIWEVENDGEKNELPLDVNDEIRFRVTAETFTDTFPGGPVEVGAGANRGNPKPRKGCPYVLHGSINEPGLGLLSWW